MNKRVGIIQQQKIKQQLKSKKERYQYIMRRQLQIPSFNHSLTQSRKERNLLLQNQSSPYYAEQQHDKNRYNDVDESDYRHNRKLFDNNFVEVDGIGHTFRANNQYWQQIYKSQSNQYKGLQSKHNLLLQSISLHHQALSLHNNQSLDNQYRLNQIQGKIKIIQSRALKNEQKISRMAQKCQQIKVSIDSTHSKVNKEQSMAIEEDRHVDQLQARISRIIGDIDGLRKQLDDVIYKEDEYGDILKRNNELQSKLYKINSEANITKIKIQKDVSQQQSIVKKMRQLQKIIKIKEKTNRQLGKKLFELKKLNPQASSMAETDRSNKLREIIRNIKQMEQSCGKLQGEIYEISDKIQMLSDKIDNKMRTIQILRLKQQNLSENSHRQQQKQKEKKVIVKKQSRKVQIDNQNKNQKVNDTFQLNQNKGLKHLEVPKKPLHYRVIESEQNENLVYPRPTKRQQTIQQNGSKSLERSENSQQQQHGLQGQSENIRVQTSQASGEQQDDSILQINQSLKNLVHKFYKYKSNSLFKH